MLGLFTSCSMQNGGVQNSGEDLSGTNTDLTWGTSKLAYSTSSINNENERLKRGDASTTIVAKVGDFEISGRHLSNKLMQFHERTGRGVNLDLDLQKSLLEDRLSRYAMVSYAQHKQWDQKDDLVYERQMIERKVWMESYQKFMIEPQVQVTDQDLRTLFYRVNTTLRASHLQTETRKEANEVYQRLMNGASFEELASSMFQTPALKNSGGDLGYFTVDDMDVSFEDRAYRMHVGDISEPVKTATGYSIIKLTERIETPVLTEQQFAQKKHSLASIAWEQKRELAVREHVKTILESFTIHEAVLEEVWERLKKSPGSYANSGIANDGAFAESFLSEIPESMRSKEIARQKIARQDFFTFTVDDFIREARFTTQRMRENAHSFSVFLEQVEGMLYRRYVLELAVRSPEISHEYVQAATDETFYNALIDEFKEYVKARVEVTEKDLQELYATDAASFLPELRINLAEIAFARREVADQAMAELKSGTLFQEVLSNYTLDAAAVGRGGEIGFLPVSAFGTLASRVAAMNPGEIAGPFEISSSHYVVVKCLEKEEPAPLTFENVKEHMMLYLEDRAYHQLKEAMINEAKKQFHAKIYEDRLADLMNQQNQL